MTLFHVEVWGVVDHVTTCMFKRDNVLNFTFQSNSVSVATEQAHFVLHETFAFDGEVVEVKAVPQ